ncbi:serine hydrolase domain-containing protein [Peristeroidobacter soli]|uniref:serine hydrolase domain-containing protein n=1 Tax=Peristeroidobacter soli TaxID=2497877 RepID=UPI001300830E|nr:serine hydrolase domain-containing protein [Peristeroidobacter soli]
MTVTSVALGSDPMEQRLDRLLTQATSGGDKPGIAVAIQRGTQVIYSKGFGYADVEHRIPVTPDTVFPIGSITKTMTGLAITQLVAAGKIDLDAPAGKYVPELPAPARDALVRHLLNHTSGLVNYTDLPEFPRGAERPVTRAEVLSWFATKPLQFEPGTRYNYTNSGTFLLGLIIEHVTGQTYNDYVGQHVFAPFGMQHTSMSDWRTLVDHRAHGYQHSKTGLVNAPRYDPLVAFSAGAVMSTTGDMLKYRAGVFTGNATPAAIRERLHRLERLRDGTLVPYSLGCLVHVTLDGHRRIMHSGDISGFSAHYSYYPDDDTTLVVLTNSDSGVPPVSLEAKLARVVLGIAEPRRDEVPLPESLGQSYAGEYTMGPITFGFTRMGFKYQNGVLYAVFGGADGPSLPLKHLGNGRFISTIDDEHTFQFERAGKQRRLVTHFYGGEFTASAQ